MTMTVGGVGEWNRWIRRTGDGEKWLGLVTVLCRDQMRQGENGMREYRVRRR